MRTAPTKQTTQKTAKTPARPQRPCSATSGGPVTTKEQAQFAAVATDARVTLTWCGKSNSGRSSQGTGPNPREKDSTYTQRQPTTPTAGGSGSQRQTASPPAPAAIPMLLPRRSGRRPTRSMMQAATTMPQSCTASTPTPRRSAPATPTARRMLCPKKSTALTPLSCCQTIGTRPPSTSRAGGSKLSDGVRWIAGVSGDAGPGLCSAELRRLPADGSGSTAAAPRSTTALTATKHASCRQWQNSRAGPARKTEPPAKSTTMTPSRMAPAFMVPSIPRHSGGETSAM
mmetsp:Transcript_51212/g.148717  ORF Transcript_51212/g.148717 Transcript_51212/m.148717 type:complete len:286 (+) Transcript_51212:175-1032(+)